MNELLDRTIDIEFYDDPHREIQALYHEANIARLVELVNEGDLTEEAREDLGRHLAYFADMFDSRLPEVNGRSPEEVLRAAARDIQVSRILKERGVARLYRLCRSYSILDIPVDEFGTTETVQVRTFQTLNNPDTGEPFKTQEEFLTWFTSASHISRSLIFMRFADLDRLTDGLEMQLEEAYSLLITKPSVISSVTRDVVKWDKNNNIVAVDPDVATRLAKSAFGIDTALEIESLAESYKEREDSATMEELVSAIKPAVVGLLGEVALHESTRDANRMVQDNILLAPQIIYEWDEYLGSLLVTMVSTVLNEYGEVESARKTSVAFIPDLTEEVPKEIVRDIVTRLPIKNRSDLDIQ